MTRAFSLRLLCGWLAPLVLSGCLASGGDTRLGLVATGFAYTEGPAADRHGNLYFTDYKDGPGRIYRLDPAGRLTLVVADSGRANGLQVGSSGELIACQADGRVVAFSPDGSRVRVLTDSYRGRRYNAPNDLALDSAGGVYFTDPFFEAPRPRPQGVAGVYYLAADGSVSRLIDCLRGPNGIALSPDGRTLYVVPSLERHVMAYPVLRAGLLGPGRPFCRLAPSGISFFPGGDGAAVDVAGNLYVATISGVQVFDPAGRALGVIRVPERPSNVAFGGPDRRTLFVTAGGSLYAAEAPLPGDPPP